MNRIKQFLVHGILKNLTEAILRLSTTPEKCHDATS